MPAGADLTEYIFMIHFMNWSGQFCETKYCHLLRLRIYKGWKKVEMSHCMNCLCKVLLFLLFT